VSDLCRGIAAKIHHFHRRNR